MVTGSCLCGGVQFRITGALAPIQLCHCSQCRRAQGTPFASNMPIVEDGFELSSGAELLKSFESSPGKQRVFCSRCGSPIYSKKADLPGVLRLRAGLIHEPIEVRPVAHFHVESRANWYEIQDALPQYADAYRPDQPPLQRR